MSRERTVPDLGPLRRAGDQDERRGVRGPVPRASWIPRHRPTRWLILALVALPFAVLAGGHNGATLVGVISAVIYLALLIAEAPTTKGNRP